MKKILVLNYEFPPLGGGASPVSYEIAQKLSGTGDFDIDVVTMGYKNLPRHEEVNPHFRIHRVRCLRSKKEICHPWEQLTYLFTGYIKSAQLIKKLKEQNQAYDICHTHFIIPTGVISYFLKKRFGLKYIITSHGSDVPGFNNDRFKFLHKFTKPFLKTIINNAKTIISPSNYLKTLILENISKTYDEKVVIIPNGIDAEKFTPQPKKKQIFSSGRLLPRKGFQYLIQAVSDEDMGYEVHIAGDGPMMNELKQLALKSKTKVVLHGWLDNRGQEYKDLLEQSAVYVLASEKENASIALLEAMSAGCAMITTNVSGCPETVGDAGVIVSPRNSEEINNALKKIIENESGWGSEARDRVLDVYDWKLILNNYIQKIL